MQCSVNEKLLHREDGKMVVVDRFRTQGNESRRLSRHLCLELTLGLFWVSLCWDVQRCMVKATGGLPGLCVPISVSTNPPSFQLAGLRIDPVDT